MSARRTRRPQSDPEQAMTAVELEARAIPAASVVMSVVVRVVGAVPVRLDLTHAGTAQQQLGLSMGTVLVYLNLRELQQTGEESAGRLISRESE